LILRIPEITYNSNLLSTQEAALRKMRYSSRACS
jgi:hypothetical protein